MSIDDSETCHTQSNLKFVRPGNGSQITTSQIYALQTVKRENGYTWSKNIKPRASYNEEIRVTTYNKSFILYNTQYFSARVTLVLPGF